MGRWSGQKLVQRGGESCKGPGGPVTSPWLDFPENNRRGLGSILREPLMPDTGLAEGVGDRRALGEHLGPKPLLQDREWKQSGRGSCQVPGATSRAKLRVLRQDLLPAQLLLQQLKSLNGPWLTG